jgi:hypothetical protein
MDENDPRVQKILNSVCWAKDCGKMSEIKTGFVQPWKEREKPCLCEIHQVYLMEETHYGIYNEKEKKWSCCGKRDLKSYCEDLENALATFRNSIPITPQQQSSFEISQQQLEQRIDDCFTSCCWDRC